MSVFYADDCISIQSKNGVATINFSSKKNKNAIGFKMAQQLANCVDRNGAVPKFSEWLLSEQPGALVLNSSLDDIFLSGGDVKELESCDKTQGHIYATQMREFCMGLNKLNIPTVTLLKNAAYGGGAEIALATDFRFITEKGALHFLQSRWGVPGGWNGMARLGSLTGFSPRKVGLLFACAATFDSATLLHLGLADAIIPRLDDLNATVVSLAKKFAACDVVLRNSLLQRGQNTGSLEDTDARMFESFWLGSKHQNFLTEYKLRRTDS